MTYIVAMENIAVNPVSRAKRRYFVEFSVSITAYALAIAARHWLLQGPLEHAEKGWQIASALLPIIPAVFLFAAIVRWVRDADELYRRVCVDALAVAGGVTALLALTYGLIEGEHFPRVSAWWTYGAFMFAWFVAAFFVQRRYR